jgi:hypothetical protein
VPAILAAVIGGVAGFGSRTPLFTHRSKQVEKSEYGSGGLAPPVVLAVRSIFAPVVCMTTGEGRVPSAGQCCVPDGISSCGGDDGGAVDRLDGP